MVTNRRPLFWFAVAGLGIKETLPPYLDPDLNTQDLITGVSFASAGAGYDNLTAEAAVSVFLLDILNSEHFKFVCE